MRTLVVLLLVSSSLAGCVDMIPDPPGYQEPDWITEYHNFTLEYNSTLPVISFGNNDSFLEVFSIDMKMNLTTNETNLTYPIGGYLSQDGFLFDYGFAPHMGNATLVLNEMKGFDYNCTVVYREWDGGPYE